MEDRLPTFEADLRPWKRAWLAAWVPLLVVGGFAWLMTHEHHKPIGLVGLFYFLIIAGSLIVTFGRKLLDGKLAGEDARVRIDAAGVWLDEKLRLPRAKILGGAHLRPREQNGLSVRIPSTVPFRSLDLRVKDEAQAEEILAALGQDPEHATVRFRLQSGFENRVLRGIATVLLMTLSTGNFWWGASSSGFFFYVMLVWMIAVLASLLSFVVPTYVTVGTDGVHIERRGRKRFVRFATVRAIESDPELADAVVIELEGDEKVTLRTSVQDRKGIAATEDGRALRVRLESALARFRARKKEGDALLVLQRGGRTTTEWIASLESLRREQGYRELRVSEEALWSVLEDPSASSEDRAAALVALRGDADDAAKTRRRVALEASAEPRLRVVLAAAEKEDSAELEAAMSALREEEKA